MSKYDKIMYKSAKRGLRPHCLEDDGLLEVIASVPVEEGVIMLATQAPDIFSDYCTVISYYLTINFPWMGASLFIADQVLLLAGMSLHLPCLLAQLDTLDGVYVWSTEEDELLLAGIRAITGARGVMEQSYNEVVSPGLAVAVAALSCCVNNLVEQRERRLAMQKMRRSYEIVDLEKEEVQRETAPEDLATPPRQVCVHLALADSELTAAAGFEKERTAPTIITADNEKILPVEDAKESMPLINTSAALETVVSNVSSAGRTSGASSPLSESGDATAVYFPTTIIQEKASNTKISEKIVSSKGLCAQAKAFVPSQRTLAKIELAKVAQVEDAATAVSLIENISEVNTAQDSVSEEGNAASVPHFKWNINAAPFNFVP